MRSAARVASAFIDATAKCRPRTMGRLVLGAPLASDSPSCPIVTPANKQITMPASAIRFIDRMGPPFLVETPSWIIGSDANAARVNEQQLAFRVPTSVGCLSNRSPTEVGTLNTANQTRV